LGYRSPHRLQTIDGRSLSGRKKPRKLKVKLSNFNPNCGVIRRYAEAELTELLS